MRANGVPVPTSRLRASKQALGRASCLALVMLGAGALVLPASAAAWEPKSPEYSLSVVEGVTTLPEESILSTRGSVRPRAQVVLSIVHDGTVVAKDTESAGDAWLSQVPQAGDVVNLESPSGKLVGSVVYDGLPSMDPTVCGGSRNFSGQRSAGEEVEGSYETLVPHPSYTAHRLGGVAQVTVLSGSSFAGSFLTPLAFGETIQAVERLRTPLAGGAVFNYSSENDRPVGACPVPPAPPPPPPPPALQGSIFKLAYTTIHKLLRFGWLSQVTINQPGTVTEDLYLQGGTLPAFASSVGNSGRHHKRKPAALLLGRGTATAKSAGKVDVVIHLTAKGRRVLRHARHVKAVLITTLSSTSGAKLNLERRLVSLHA